jgi:hypothetical protein
MQRISANGSGGVCGTVFYIVPANGGCSSMTLACSGEVRIGENIGVGSDDMLADGTAE